MRVVVGVDTVKLTGSLKVRYYPIAGTGIAHDLDNASGFDTDEKWVEVVLLAPRETPNAHGKYVRAMTADGHLVKARLHINYDVVDKATGITHFQVRQ